LSRQADRPDALAQLAGLLLSVNRPEAARERLQEALQIEPDHATAHLAMAYLLAAEGAAQEADVHLDAALRSRPSTADEVAKLRAKLRKGPGERKPPAAP
jgi:Tfp pilus assembly protein PilF